MKKLLVASGAALVALVLALMFSSQMRERPNRSGGLIVVPRPTVPAPDSAAPVSSANPTGPRSEASDDTAVNPAPPLAPGASIPLATTPSRPPIVVPVPATPIQQGPEAAAVLRRTSEAYSAVRSMKADFTSQVDNPLLGRRTSHRGTVFQRRPDRFLMKYSDPAGDVVVSDGQYFWVYYPSVDAKQVLRARASETGGLDLQAQFVGDPTTRFQHTDHGSETVAGRSTRVITLVPRTDAGYKTLKVWIDTRDHLVRRFEITMENDVVQHYDLSNLETNVELGDAMFRFTPPPGARVIDR